MIFTQYLGKLKRIVDLVSITSISKEITLKFRFCNISLYILYKNYGIILLKFLAELAIL